MKIFKILCFAVMSIVIAACGNDKKETTPEVVTVDNSAKVEKSSQYRVPTLKASFKDQGLEAVFKKYTILQNELVKTDAVQAKEAAIRLHLAFTENNIKSPAIEIVNMMTVTSDIEELRTLFEKVSMEVEKLLEGQIASGMIYKVHCPMAFNNKGASWLSAEKIVQNPYFGDRMLKCGRIEKAIQ